jgi:hypothetical protein
MNQEHLMIITTLQAEVTKLRNELQNTKQQQVRRRRVTLCVNPAGGVTLYGIGKYPISLFKNQWMRLLHHGSRIQEFIQVNNNLLKDNSPQLMPQ